MAKAFLSLAQHAKSKQKDLYRLLRADISGKVKMMHRHVSEKRMRKLSVIELSVIGVIVAEVSLHVMNIAKFTGIKDSLCLAENFAVAIIFADHQETALFVIDTINLLSILALAGDRFLTHYGNTLTKEQLIDACVSIRRSDVDNKIRLAFINCCNKVSIAADIFGNTLKTLLAAVNNSNQLSVFAALRQNRYRKTVAVLAKA